MLLYLAHDVRCRRERQCGNCNHVTAAIRVIRPWYITVISAFYPLVQSGCYSKRAILIYQYHKAARQLEKQGTSKVDVFPLIAGVFYLIHLDNFIANLI